MNKVTKEEYKMFGNVIGDMLNLFRLKAVKENWILDFFMYMLED